MKSRFNINNIIHSPQLSAEDAALVIRNMKDTLYRVDKKGGLSYVSPASIILTGYSDEELIGMQVTDLYMYPEDRDKFMQILSDSNGKLDNYEVELKHKDGHGIWVLINVHSILDDNGEYAGIEGLIRDISHHKNMEAALHHEKERALVTLNSIVDGVITTNMDGKIEYMNPAAENITGWQTDEAMGINITRVFNPVDSDGQNSLGQHPVFTCLKTGEGIITPNIRLFRRQDNAEYAVQESASPIHDSNGKQSGAVLVFHDVTAIREMSRKLSYQACHDAHTGLFNRTEFEKRLQQNINNITAPDHGSILCYLDLDQFKLVNDTCGHVAGDALLKQLSSILQNIIRETDTIARLGGDEFGLLFEQCNLERGKQIADNIRKTIKEFRFVWDDKIFEVGVSIGIVEINHPEQTVTELLSMADAACFVAKDNGRNRIHVYQQDDHDLSRQRMEMQWIHQINRAFDDNSFVLYHQKIVAINDSHDGLPAFHEILVRILDKGKLIPPMGFIPAAERYGMMQNIDRWVVSKTFTTLDKQFQQGDTRLKMYSINLSGASLTNTEFLDFILDKLDYVSFPAHWICYEITETAAISNLKQASHFIQQLKSRGCRFALDDFGSGLSSFTYLKNLPVDYLKIDGSFVQNMVNDSVDAAMIASINNIGHIMGLKTIAEFVDDERQAVMLKDIGIDYAQGYLYAKPVPFGID